MPLREHTNFERQRRHPRVPWSERLDLQTMSWPHLSDAVARDISYGGLGLELTHPVRPGDRFVFVLTLADGRSKQLTAEVRYAAPDGRVGLSWLDLDRESRAAVERFVDGLAARAA